MRLDSRSTVAHGEWTTDPARATVGHAVSTGAVSTQTPEPVLAERRRGRRSPPPVATVQLHVLGSFRVTIDDAEVSIPHHAQRLLVLLALRQDRLLRSFAAGMLWLDVPEERAAANLRSVLWRLRGLHVPIIDTRHGFVGLLPEVSVDLYEKTAVARRWLTGTETEPDLAAGSTSLESELLPDWYEEWVAEERDRYRQLRVHALEAVAERLAAAGQWGAAVEAALAALAADPLRESAHRALIGIHLAEGNVAEAIRQLHRCERLLMAELGVLPSFDIDDVMRAAAPSVPHLESTARAARRRHRSDGPVTPG